jgi:L-seryl-tRNA(Ser) seleniumtransferase
MSCSRRWQAAVAPRFTVQVVDLLGQIGSGSLPVDRLPSAGLAWRRCRRRAPAARWTNWPPRCAACRMPVIGRMADDRLLLDLRCLEDSAPFVNQLPALRQALS